MFRNIRESREREREIHEMYSKITFSRVTNSCNCGHRTSDILKYFKLKKDVHRVGPKLQH